MPRWGHDVHCAPPADSTDVIEPTPVRHIWTGNDGAQSISTRTSAVAESPRAALKSARTSRATLSDDDCRNHPPIHQDDRRRQASSGSVAAMFSAPQDRFTSRCSLRKVAVRESQHDGAEARRHGRVTPYPRDPRQRPLRFQTRMLGAAQRPKSAAQRPADGKTMPKNEFGQDIEALSERPQAYSELLVGDRKSVV